MDSDVEIKRRKPAGIRKRKGNGSSRTLSIDKDIKELPESDDQIVFQNGSGSEYDVRKIVAPKRGGVRKGAGRKPKDPAVQQPSAIKPKSNVDLLDETGKIYSIYRKLVYEAKSFDQIAQEMDVPPGEIRKYIQKACEKMNVEIEHMKESWLSMVLLQSNAIIGTLMPAILRTNSNGDDEDEDRVVEPDHRSIQSWVNVTKLNVEVISLMTAPKMPNIQAGQVIMQQNNAFTPTMSGTSKLYEIGVQEMMDGKNIGKENLEEIIHGSAKRIEQVAEHVGISED